LRAWTCALCDAGEHGPITAYAIAIACAYSGNVVQVGDAIRRCDRSERDCGNRFCRSLRNRAAGRLWAGHPYGVDVGAALTVVVGTNFGAGQFARTRKIAWSGAAATFVIIGGGGAPVALVPSLWLNLFTSDSKAYEFGALYLIIAAPCYGLFAGRQALYFASQGTGNIVLPVLVNVLRLAVVVCLGVLAIFYSWPINAFFVGVALGLAVIGVGLALCMRTAAWRPERYQPLSAPATVVSSEESKSVFYDPFARRFVAEDAREHQYVLLGKSSQSNVIVVVHSLHGASNALEVISAREATPGERNYYRGSDEAVDEYDFLTMRSRRNPYAAKLQQRLASADESLE
jgi:uncharacterized DUF497 family protein